jgi:hypothetical protein
MSTRVRTCHMDSERGPDVRLLEQTRGSFQIGSVFCHLFCPETGTCLFSSLLIGHEMESSITLYLSLRRSRAKINMMAVPILCK